MRDFRTELRDQMNTTTIKNLGYATEERCGANGVYR